MAKQQANIRVHTTHCCKLHGCKYCDKDCPVEFGGVQQEYPCESCGLDGISTIQELKDQLIVEDMTIEEKHAALQCGIDRIESNPRFNSPLPEDYALKRMTTYLKTLQRQAKNIPYAY